MFIATGMDGLIEMDENIVPLNYWNKEMLKEKKVFDTQKGIVRDIDVKKLKNENIKIMDLSLIQKNLSLMHQLTLKI